VSREVAPRAERGDGSVLKTLFAYEMRMVLRDRRTLMIAVVAPVILFPLMILVMRAVDRSEEARLGAATYVYGVDGSHAAEARAWVEGALALAVERDSTGAEHRFEERTAPASLDSLLDAGAVHVVVRAVSPREWYYFRDSVEAERADGEAGGADGEGPDELDGAPASALNELPVTVPVLRLLYRANSELSRTGAQRMNGALRDFRVAEQERLYRERGLPVEPAAVASITSQTVASAEREGGAVVGLVLTPLLLFLMLSGGSIVAADAIAGEKERGTLETLLTTAARRAQIVDAKMLAIIAVGLAVALVNVLNLLLYLVIGVVELPEDFAVRPSAVALGVILLLLLPLTVLVASVLLLLSGYAKSYKEYQIYFFPVFLLFVVPSLAGMLPGMELRSLIALVPIANVGVAVREVMIGEYDWPFLLLALASTSFAAAAFARLTGRTLSIERLISHADLDEADLEGGEALFSRRVIGWFGVMWAVILVTSLWFGQSLGLRGQVVLNLVGIFLGGTVLMIWRYRLPVREALALRPVRPFVWLAVLIGAPSALYVGNGIAQLAEYVIPVPQEVIESFGQYLLPDDLPLWQVVFFLALLPGICEELAFRGVLMYGLRRHLRPIPLALLVGLIFGLFHVALFRLLPTAYMGTLLAGVTLLTGSIFPAIVWHAVNNASALVPAYLGWVPPSGPVQPWTYWAALAGLALAFWILWRQRTPYPGLVKGKNGQSQLRNGAPRPVATAQR
jgi:sodium transport system permease protein